MNNIEMNKLVKFSKTLKVLYVEDNKEVREQVVKILENFFINISIAVDGKDGLEKFKKNKFSLIITDINMPNKNGIEMLKEIKKQDEEVFCLIVSAHNESNYFIDSIELAVDGFLLKPVKYEQFTSLIFKTIKRIQNKYDANESNIRQAKLASMGEMIDSIAHQWMQPLGIIKMRLQMLDYTLNDGLITDEMIKETVQSSDDNIEHLIETMNEFRTFFRPVTNKEIITLKSIIDSTLILIKDELISNTISAQIQGDIDTQVNLNANEFKHIIINILNNAKDAFVDNNIDGEEREIILYIQKRDEKVIFTISDNAGGIPEHIINRIFEPNFTTKDERKGTGIGLYMTKQIIDKIGATIEVENIDNGASFKITI